MFEVAIKKQAQIEFVDVWWIQTTRWATKLSQKNSL